VCFYLSQAQTVDVLNILSFFGDDAKVRFSRSSSGMYSLPSPDCIAGTWNRLLSKEKLPQRQYTCGKEADPSKEVRQCLSSSHTSKCMADYCHKDTKLE
jgi:hypothetical protein